MKPFRFKIALPPFRPKVFVKKTAFSALRIYLLLCVGLYFLQDHLLYRPSSDAEFAAALDSNPNIVETKIPTEDGGTVGRSTGTGNCLVTYFGGNAENVDYYFVDGVSPYAGCVFSAVNYRGYGRSGGKPNETKMHADALAWYDEMNRIYHPKTNYVVGRSLGTNVAAFVAANRNPDKLVLVTPYDSIANVAQSKYPIVPVKYLIHDAFDTAEFADALKMPVLVAIAENDQVIPRERTDALVSKLGAKTKTVLVPQADHNTVVESKVYSEKVGEFLR